MSELQTRESLAAGVVDKWKEQYAKGGEWGDIYIGGYAVSAKTIYDALVALGPTPCPDKVDEVIGNGSWTHLYCNECRQRVDLAVCVGEEPDYDSATAYLCEPCLRAAYALLPVEATP